MKRRYHRSRKFEISLFGLTISFTSRTKRTGVILSPCTRYIFILKEQGILRGVLPRRALRDPDQLFLEAELALALIAMANTQDERPFLGNYVYAYASTTHRAACRLLEKGGFLEEVLGKPIRKALEGLLQALKAMRGSLPCFREGIIGLARCLERDTGAG